MDDDARSGAAVAFSTQLHPRAGVAAVVHAVVDEARVAAHRDAPAGRAEVGLGGDRVLRVAQVVGDVGEQLDERDAEIGRRGARATPGSARPCGRASAAGSSRSPWRGSRCRSAAASRAGGQTPARAVEVARALDLEREVDRRQQRVEDLGRTRVVRGRHDLEAVDGEVPARGRSQRDRARRRREHRRTDRGCPGARRRRCAGLPASAQRRAPGAAG